MVAVTSDSSAATTSVPDAGAGPVADPGAGAGTSGPPTTGAEAVRYRCAACGNLTRFDVVTTRRTRAFHHYSVGGVLTIEDVDVLGESVEEVTCRWCGNGAAVEVLGTNASQPS